MTATRFIVLGLLALVVLAPVASAHKTVTTPDGALKFVFGFLNEPTVSMTKNGIDLRIVDNATGYAIPDLQSGLHIEMHYGDFEMEVDDFGGQFGKPGYYTGVITPSRPGIYTLHISGTINGTEVELEIPTSHEVTDINETYFPPVSGGSLGDLQAKVDALQMKVDQLDAKLKTQATTPTSVATQKDTPGFEPALLVGALGAVALALALRRKA